MLTFLCLQNIDNTYLTIVDLQTKVQGLDEQINTTKQIYNAVRSFDVEFLTLIEDPSSWCDCEFRDCQIRYSTWSIDSVFSR